MTRTLILSIAVLALACSRESKSAYQVVQAWKAAGLQPSEFTKADTRLGGKCQSGTVNEIDTLICEFKDETEAKQAQPKGLEIVGETTGASLAKGRMLLVVADRKNSDPNGKRLKDITNTFRQ
jgi:hypothetical protein